MGETVRVLWDGGIFLPEAGLWLDPPVGRELAFISHAHSDHVSFSQRTICSPETRVLMEARYGEAARGTEFVCPGWGETVEVAGHALRLHPAGHVLGSAMLHATRLADGATFLYTGDFKLRGGFSSEPADFPEAETVVMETTFGRPEFVFPPREVVAVEVLKFVRETLEDGGVPVLLGYSLGKGQEILALLGAAEVPVMVHRSMAGMTQVYGKMGREFPAWRPFRAEEAAGHVLVFPPSAARSPVIRKLRGVRLAMLTGWAMSPGARFRYQVDEVFPMSDHADYAELLEFVERVRPREIFTVHGFTAEFARDLRRRGHAAWSLREADQLELAMEVSPLEAGNETAEIAETAAGFPLAEDFAVAAASEENDAFGRFARVCAAVGAEPSRLGKRDLLAGYLRELAEEDLVRVVGWFSGNLADGAPVNAGWAVIRGALRVAGGINEAALRNLSRSQNDAGRTAFLVLAGRKFSAGGNTTLGEVAQLFRRLRETSGQAGKTALLAEALAEMAADEGSWLVRLLTGDLRIGMREGLVEEAVATASCCAADELREAAMLCGDAGVAALLARRGELAAAQPQLFVPVKVMLASPEETADAIWERLGPQAVWLEDKYDGIRAQIHASPERVEIFTRDLKNVTSQFPEIAGAEGIAEGMILDGEIIAFAEDKKLGFHDLQRRLGRKGEADLFFRSDISLRFVVFDLLWLDGAGLLREPLADRRKLLEQRKFPVDWKLIEVLRAETAGQIEAAFHSARRRGNEGLIAKDPAGIYRPGRRGKTWLKLKKAFSTLDVVVVKAEQGHGRRSHVLSDYTFAVRDETGALRTIGKAYSGLTDEEIEELTEHFSRRTISKRGNVRTVTPDVVLEIAFDSIRPSARHDSGLALRFPRIKAIRRDKSAEEIDTLAYARRLAGVEPSVGAK